VLFFLAYFVLVLKKKNLERTYQIPGGKIVKLIVAGVGLLMSVAAIVSAFFPPTSLSKSSDMSYEIILAASFIVTILIP
ncbi:glutamate:gamma-aminobutyrate antiporter, partial [Escherichia coli]|nr:glutamate:gamma-aminobutyrate antiporter [Escherichia coli]